MDMYQKRKIRQEKKSNENNAEKSTKVGINCENRQMQNFLKVLKNEHFTNFVSFVI